MENLFHSQTDKSHHTHRNFGDWIMQQPQINIYEKKIEERLSTCVHKC